MKSVYFEMNWNEYGLKDVLKVDYIDSQKYYLKIVWYSLCGFHVYDTITLTYCLRRFKDSVSV